MGVDLLIAHPIATTAPWKLSEYRQHTDPPGINGVLVEGRNRFDAFVLDNKRGALATHRSAKIILKAVNEAGETGATRVAAVEGAQVLSGSAGVAMGTLCYKADASDIAETALGADISNKAIYPEMQLGEDIAAASGAKMRVYLKDRHGRLIGESVQFNAVLGA